MKYIIELEPGVYIAPWTGDPGRTMKIENALDFASPLMAEKVMKRVLSEECPHRHYKNAKVIELS